MPRLFNTRRLFLCGKNRFTLCSGIYVLLLGFISTVVVMQLHRNSEPQELGVHAPPSPRIFCIIATFAYRHDHMAIHLHRTWVKHCDHYLFVSDDVHYFLEPAVFLHLHDKWQQMRAHLGYVYKNHFNQGDWFIYANDDNFVIVENLRHMLMSYSPDELIYFGCKLRSPNGQIFMHDASGIVFSRAALKRFSLAALTNESICSSEKRGNEATEELGRCLTNVNVIPGNSRDELLGHRFLPFESDVHLGGVLNRSLDMHKYFLDYSYYPVIDMNVPVSLSSICFKLHSYGDCYDLYYFTYKVRMFGLSSHLNTGNEIMG